MSFQKKMTPAETWARLRADVNSGGMGGGPRYSIADIDQMQRAAVVAEARRWLGTPYHHAADVLGAGCDCGMMIVRVFVDSGLVAAFDPRPYPRDWHLHRDEERYLGFVIDRAREVETPSPGDVVVFRHGRSFSHGGIVSAIDPIRLVHASWPARMVIEEALEGSPFAAKPQRYFSYWGGRP